MAAGSRSNQVLVKNARPALDAFKWETAAELGINVQPGSYMGDLPARVNGAIGGNMVRKMIQLAEASLAGTNPTTPTS